MTSDNESQNGTVHPALKSLRSVELSPSPFLASRVQANLDAARVEQKPASSFGLAWIGGLTLAVIIALTITMFRAPRSAQVPVYALNQPYLIKVDIRALTPNEVAYAEIEIKGDAATFNSKAFEDVDVARKLVLDGSVLQNKQYLPIIVKGVRRGQSEVAVNFYDRNHKLIASRFVDLAFAEGT